MIIRIVRMTFAPERTDEFLAIFEASKAQIRAFEGCRRLELLQDADTPNVMMTYSWWDSEEALEQYRHSVLFKTTWAKTKVLFADKPAAFSARQRLVLD